MTGSLDIELRVKNLEASISKIKKDFSSAGNDVEKGLTNAGQKSASNITSAFAKVGTFIKGIFALAVFGQVLSYGKQLIGLGSDLNEETSKLTTVFKGMGDTAIQTFTDLAESQGRSRLDMIKYGATIGNIATSFGLAREQSLELSRSIVQLGTDIASFGNVSDDQAIGALRSALTGEFEPLKNLGYAINETDIKNKAFTLGLAKQGDELTRGQKLLAAYQLILDRTASAQGDAVRTGAGFANQLKRIQGTIKDTLAESGTAIASQTAGSLATVNSFIQKYGVSIISAMVEVGKSIGSVFLDIGDVVTDVLKAFGVDLGEGGSRMDKFGRVTIFVLETLGIGIRTLGFLFGYLVKFSIAAISDIVTIFTNVPKIIYKPFQAIGQIIMGFFENISHNMGVLVEMGIGAVITKVNGFIVKMNSLLGTSIGTFQPVVAGVLKVGDSWKDSLASANNAQAEMTAVLKSNSANLSKYIIDGITKLDNANTESTNRIKAANERAGKSVKDDLGKPLVSVQDLMKGLGADSENAGNKQEKASKAAKEAAAKLKDSIEAVKKSYDKLADEQGNIVDKIKEIEKAHKKMTDTIKMGLLETTEKIKTLAAEYAKTIAEINSDEQSKKTSGKADYIRTLAEQEASLKKDIAEMDKKLNAGEGDIDLINQKNEKLKEQLRINQILDDFAKKDKSLVDSEKNRAGLGGADRSLLDFNAAQQAIMTEADTKRQAEDAKYKAENERLKKTQDVYKLFDEMQTTSFNKLNKMKTEELTKGLDADQVALFNKLYTERLEYARLIQDKTIMENDLNAHIIQLSNDATQVQKDNIASLTVEYTKLIGQINQAVASAKALQQVRTGNIPGRVDGGPVSAGQPYMVGENPDGSLNRTSELFIPNVNGQIISADKIREAVQASSISNDNSRKIEVGQIITQNNQDFNRAMEKLLFRL